MSSDCMDVEVNRLDETEDEITSSDEFVPPIKRFMGESTNNKEYFKEFKSAL